MRLTVFVIVFLVSESYSKVDFNDRPLNISIELVYHTQDAVGGHVVLSPFGIWTMLSALLPGTTGDSFKQIQRAFILPTGTSALATGYKGLTSAILNPLPPTGVIFTNRNFFIIDKDFRVDTEFQNLLKQKFDVSLLTLDFKQPNVSEIANSEIKATGANVKNLLKAADFTDKAMILSNFIYFKGQWTVPFDVSNTAEEPFYDEDDHIIGRVNMMEHKSGFVYSNIRVMEAYALELPYGTEKRYSMLFMLPYPDVKVAECYKNLAKISFKDIFKQIERDVKDYGDEEIAVKIPRFKISSQLIMNKPLNDLGVYDIFERDYANFTGITGEELFVSEIVHKADIDVTESGTEASAATKVVFSGRVSAPPFHANRPFIYFLMEKSTMTMLFGGIYSKPTVF